jgi:hypothetical protein
MEESMPALADVGVCKLVAEESIIEFFLAVVIAGLSVVLEIPIAFSNILSRVLLDTVELLA